MPADLTNCPDRCKPGVLAMTKDKPLAHLDKEGKIALVNSVFERYQDGAEIVELAAEVGISHQRMYRMLIETNAEQWKAVQSSRALVQFQETYEELSAANDAVAIARAREKHRSAQWQLEKLLRRLYGDDKALININIDHRSIELREALEQAKQRLGIGQVVEIGSQQEEGDK